MEKEIKLDFLKTTEKKKIKRNMKNEKRIEIKGTNNRYQIKKLTTDKVEVERQNIDHINEDEFLIDNQLSLLTVDNKMVEKSIKAKRQSYYQQDILKKCYNDNAFISFGTIIEKLKESKCKCFYCRENLYILYKVKLEKKQWTLDRIDNTIGHNTDNVVICCLECNLERKNKSQDKYMYDMNLKIEKI